MGKHEKARKIPTTLGHDDLCPYAIGSSVNPEACPFCYVISRAAARERARWSPPTPTVPGHAALCWCPSCTTPHAANTEVAG